MSVQTPFVTPFVSIRDFGAMPNDPRLLVRQANSEAFEKAQAAMQSPGQAWGHPLLVPSGTFFLAGDLHISKQLELFGTGLQGESLLMFPAGKSLIIDRGDGDDPTRDGSQCVIRDLQIISEENWVTNTATPFDADSFEPPTLEGTSKGTPGIRMGTTAIIQRVYIKGFTGSGIHVRRIGSANVNQWWIHDVYIESCGGHGIHVGGHGLESTGQSETQGGLCTGARIFTVAGNGIYENSFGGNTYVGCYVEETKGRGYSSESPGQVSFIGCFAEALEPVRLSRGGNVWIGGGSGGFTSDTTAFIALGYGDVHPFEIPNLSDPTVRLFVGYPNDKSDPISICAWQNDQDGFYVMCWDMANKIWAVENGSINSVRDDDGRFLGLQKLGDRSVATYLTQGGHPRGPWLQGFPAMLLGQADSAIRISRGNRPDDGTGEPGDIVYNSNPEIGDYIGYVCTGAARMWKPFGKIDDSP